MASMHRQAFTGSRIKQTNSFSHTEQHCWGLINKMTQPCSLVLHLCPKNINNRGKNKTKHTFEKKKALRELQTNDPVTKGKIKIIYGTRHLVQHQDDATKKV